MLYILLTKTNDRLRILLVASYSKQRMFMLKLTFINSILADLVIRTNYALVKHTFYS